MQPARVELWWLYALPLDQELLLGLVMAYQPFGPLIRHAKQFSDDSYRDDGLRLKSWFFCAISEEEYLSEVEVPLMFVFDGLHILLR